MNTNFDQLKEAYDLTGKRVAVIATDGFEQSELDTTVEALETCGAWVDIISVKPGYICGWDEENWGEEREVSDTLDEVSAEDYDALVIPGGELNSDTLRTFEEAVTFTRDFFEQQKPVAAICHGVQLLIEAEVVKGRKLTSYESIRKDLENAGALWEDQSVVVDQGLVTSRKPSDLPDFCRKMCEEIHEGTHARQHA